MKPRVRKRDARCAVLKVPTAGTNSWKHTQKEIDSPGGPINSNRVCLQIRNNSISAPVTVLGIHNHSRQDKQMYNTIILPTSRGINADRNINASPFKIP